MNSSELAVSQISSLALRAFVAASSTDPRLAAAKTRLGSERFVDVAISALRGALKRDLVDGAAERRLEIDVAGGFAARTILSGVVAAAVSAVLAASEELEPGSRVRAFGRVEAEVVEVFERRSDGRVPVLCRRIDSGVECLPFADELEVVGVTR